MRELFTLLLCVTAINAGARQITFEEAAKIASEFICSRMDVQSISKQLNLSCVRGNKNVTESVQPFYVFNMEDGKGFVIVSGDDTTHSILGYSDTGAFDFNHLPPAIEWMLEQHAGQIGELTTSSANLRANSSAKFKEPIPPLITTKWGQNVPYNLECPMRNGERTVTGCVATALAQVMNYHKWPARGYGAHSYIDGYGDARAIDFSQIEFDWEAMNDEYGNENSERSKKAVATLMKACGYSVNMDYDVWGSSAASEFIVDAVQDFFDYSHNVCIFNRRDYTQDEWENIIYGQLSAGLPVIYQGIVERGTHAYICDGYDGKGYFHINWGWNGYNDGYFLWPDNSWSSYGIMNLYPSNMKSNIPTDGVFDYMVIDDGRIALIGTSNSGCKIGGDVVIPDELVFGGRKYSVTQMLRSFSELFDSENLTSLDIRIPITDIPKGAFQGASKLKSIKFPPTLQTIGSAAFYGCIGLKGSLVLPESLNSLGIQAFGECSGLTGCLTLPNSLTSIENSTFARCSNLTGLTLGNSVTTIGSAAFCGCSSLSGQLNLPNSLISIEESAFSGCSGFTGTLELPTSLKSIEYSAFKGCSGITSLKIPNSVTAINSMAFYECSSLEKLTLSANLSEIGSVVWRGCPNINEIENPAIKPCDSDMLFDDEVYTNAVLYVPLGCTNNYKTFSDCCWWHLFNNIKEKDFASIDDVVTDKSDENAIDYAAPYDVYTVTGVRINKSFTDLPPGCYIVRQGMRSEKIIICQY